MQAPDDTEDTDGNKKVSLMEFRQQYRELSQCLGHVQRVAQKSLGSQMLSEKYLAQVYMYYLLKNTLHRYTYILPILPILISSWNQLHWRGDFSCTFLLCKGKGSVCNSTRLLKMIRNMHRNNISLVMLHDVWFSKR